MAERIRAHRNNRLPSWLTLEAPLHVGAAIREANFQGNILLDCLTLLANNVMLDLQETIDENIYQKAMRKEIDDLLAAYRDHNGHWVIVSNEVGLGLVPVYESVRFYRDTLGGINQQLAAIADQVIFMVAGIPMIVK